MFEFVKINYLISNILQNRNFRLIFSVTHLCTIKWGTNSTRYSASAPTCHTLVPNPSHLPYLSHNSHSPFQEPYILWQKKTQNSPAIPQNYRSKCLFSRFISPRVPAVPLKGIGTRFETVLLKYCAKLREARLFFCAVCTSNPPNWEPIAFVAIIDLTARRGLSSSNNR